MLAVFAPHAAVHSQNVLSLVNSARGAEQPQPRVRDRRDPVHLVLCAWLPECRPSRDAGCAGDLAAGGQADAQADRGAVPLSLAEIQADKDRLRAEFAVSTRRLEINLKELRQRAAEQVVEIGRDREELKRLGAGRDETNRHCRNSMHEARDLKSELRRREEEIGRMTGRVAEADGILRERAAELEQAEPAFRGGQPCVRRQPGGTAGAGGRNRPARRRHRHAEPRAS